MRNATALFIVLWCATLVAAQEIRPAEDAAKAEAATTEDARAIMLKADEAIKKVFFVKFDGVFQGTGFMVENAPTVKGTAIQRGKAVTGFGQYRFDVKEAKLPWGENKETFVSGYDGKVYYVLDPAKKIAYVHANKEGTGRLGRLGDAMGLQYFTHPEPFADDLSAPSLRIRGEATVGDQECWEIAITYANEAKGRGVWYISKKDYLPRRMDRLVLHPETKDVGSLQWIMTNLTTVPSKEDELDFTLPPGYTQSSDKVP